MWYERQAVLIVGSAVEEKLQAVAALGMLDKTGGGDGDAVEYSSQTEELGSLEETEGRHTARAAGRQC